MANDMVISRVSPFAAWVNLTVDEVEWTPGGIVAFFEATNRRYNYAFSQPLYEKVVLSPVGVAYPGDAVAGNGAKKVTIGHKVVGAIIFNNVDNVTFVNGYTLITKGDHTIAWNPSAILETIVDPS